MDKIVKRLHKRLTQALIDENPDEFRFQRREKVAAADGGFTWGAPRSLSTAERPGVRRHSDSPTRVTPDGRIVSADFVLVFSSYTDALVGDTVELHKTTYEVISVSHGVWSDNVEVIRYE